MGGCIWVWSGHGPRGENEYKQPLGRAERSKRRSKNERKDWDLEAEVKYAV